MPKAGENDNCEHLDLSDIGILDEMNHVVGRCADFLSAMALLNATLSKHDEDADCSCVDAVRAIASKKMMELVSTSINLHRMGVLDLSQMLVKSIAPSTSTKQ